MLPPHTGVDLSLFEEKVRVAINRKIDALNKLDEEVREGQGKYRLKLSYARWRLY